MYLMSKRSEKMYICLSILSFMMKKISFIFLLVLITSCNQKKEAEYLTEAKEYQFKKNIEFTDIRSTPLTKKDFTNFSSLEYFPIQEKYRVKATFKRTSNEKVFDMLTTTSRLAKYVKYGVAKFTIDNKELSLNIYQNIKSEKHLFLPFFDLTNGKESYSGGRYIDLKYPKNEILIIDFNQSYNPYCAYNNKYSCPIPPGENSLNIKIKAGIKKFH